VVTELVEDAVDERRRPRRSPAHECGEGAEVVGSDVRVLEQSQIGGGALRP
jgi:hypothetical protein